MTDPTWVPGDPVYPREGRLHLRCGRCGATWCGEGDDLLDCPTCDAPGHAPNVVDRTRYTDQPWHPLAGVPAAALDAARAELAEVAPEFGMTQEDVEAVADAVVAALAERGHLRYGAGGAGEAGGDECRREVSG